MGEQRADSVKRYVGGLVLLGLLVPCSCANNIDNTRQAFAQKELCPPARVTVTERPMTLAEFEGDAGAPGGHSFPGDPEREQYAAKLDKDRAQFANELVGDVYEVSGCGVRALYWCHTHYLGKSQSEVCDPLLR
jgi:hypothetical protein